MIILKYIEKIYRKNLYTSIEDESFLMKDYIKIVCDNNLNALKKRPTITIKPIIAKVWIELLQQYAKKANNKEIQSRIERQDKIQTLYNRVTILKGCYFALAIKPEEQRILKFLNDSGIKADGNSKMMKRIESELKSLSIKIKEYATLNNIDKPEEKKVSRSDYSFIFVSLNKAGYKINQESSVIDFINAKNMYAKEVEENNRQVEQLKAKRNGKL